MAARLRVSEAIGLRRDEVDLAVARLWVRHLKNGLSVEQHMLRLSCGFALSNPAYDLRLFQDYLGHRDAKHTVRYTR